MKIKSVLERITNFVLVAMVAVTIANLGLRYGGARSVGIEVSTLEPGVVFPDSALNVSLLMMGVPGTKNRKRRATETHCRLIVAFRPECPACRDAARREAALGEAPNMAISWITFDDWTTFDDGIALDDDTVLIQEFAMLLRPESQVGYSAGAGRLLEVQGVPAAFLIGPDSTVEAVTAYRGDEQQLHRFEDQCAALQD